MNEQAKTSSQRVREVIHEMGFGVADPPTGWQKQVQARLKAEGVKVNDSLVYKMRRAVAGGKKSRPGKKRFANFHVNANGRPDEDTKTAAASAESITFDQLRKVRDLAKEMGGLDKLTEAVNRLREVWSDL